MPYVYMLVGVTDATFSPLLLLSLTTINIKVGWSWRNPGISLMLQSFVTKSPTKKFWRDLLLEIGLCRARCALVTAI